ncbi:MAG: hypothetical protein L7U68_03620 [Flavobacteriaceae bacterium]|nr:hypothetical protein [Flavobacteriaceae bacterium]
MRFKFLSLFVILLCCACVNAPEEKKVAEVKEQNPLQLKQENIELYQLKQDSLIDSLLLPVEEFTAFTQSMEDLTKLKPEGIAPFLLGTIIKCNALLRYQIPAPFDTPEIKSRLKVVKTALLKARYYSVEERQQELDESYEALFIAYTAYLKRIQDFSLDLQEEQESNDVIDLSQ